MGRDSEPGFDAGTVEEDSSIGFDIDDDEVFFDAQTQTGGGSGPLLARTAAAGESSASKRLRGLIERVPAARAGRPQPPLSGSVFRATDSLGGSLDALEVIANPAEPQPSYLGVYHINLGGGRFALRLAASRDLATWRKIADLDADGGGMGSLRALPGGGFLLAYEVQGPTRANAKIDTNVRLRHYRDAVALLTGDATEERTLPRRLSTTNEGTPSFRSIAWRGSIARSEIKLGFHYLDRGPKGDRFKLAVDREANGTLSNGSWSVVKEAGIDRALSRMGFHGNHGDRHQFHFPAGGKLWRIYEAQQRVNVTGSWRTLLFDVTARKMALLGVATPGRSRSFANPTVAVLRSPHPSGGDALVVSMFIFGAGAGPGESGELVYYHDL